MAVGLRALPAGSGWARPGGSRGTGLALAAAALYLFNPVTWYDSALWGQTDAAGALVLLLGVAALIRGNSEGASAMAVVAALVKPQYGVVLVPLVGVVLLRRHLFDHGPSATRHRPLVRCAAGWLGNRGPGGWLARRCRRLVVFFAMALPFGMGPIEVHRWFLAKTAGGYPYLTVNAYNPWALIGVGAKTPSGLERAFWSEDTLPFSARCRPVLVGPAAGRRLRAHGSFASWRDDRRSIVLVALFLSAAFFILPTRVHERYLFPVFAFLPILAVGSRRWTLGARALRGRLVHEPARDPDDANPVYGTPNVAHLPFGEPLPQLPVRALSVILQTAAFVFAAWQLRPSAVDESWMNTRGRPSPGRRAGRGRERKERHSASGRAAWASSHDDHRRSLPPADAMAIRGPGPNRSEAAGPEDRAWPSWIDASSGHCARPAATGAPSWPPSRTAAGIAWTC